MSHADNLKRLARLSVGFGLNLQEGQDLIITAPIEARDLVLEVTRAAYDAGAVNILPLFADDAAQLARFEHGHAAIFDAAPGWLFEALAGALKNGAARLAISGNTPGLLAGQNPDRVARANSAMSKAVKPFLEAITQGTTNWNIIPFVTEGWAAQVFPDLPLADAVTALWGHVFRAVRLDHADPVAAWQDNFAMLYKRRDALQEMALSAVHFQGGGTDLTVGLAKGHLWVGGGLSRADGVAYAPNLPTEEVFTMPDKNRTEGRAVFTKPAVIGGTIVEGLVVEFQAGRAVEINADSGAEVARTYFTSDAGASRLGEVALVAQSSPIAQSGVLFFNTLFDETPPATSPLAIPMT